MLWSWSASTARRPIAVFCDGWAYHKESLREDALKRSALVNSGRFWVWSVTHNDVAAALKGDLSTDLESPLTCMSRHQGQVAPEKVPRAQEGAFTQHAVARLLHWLATPCTEAADPVVKALQRNALWLGFLMVPNDEVSRAACMTELAAWQDRLPAHARRPGKGWVPSVAKPTAPCRYFGTWPMDVARNGLVDGTEVSAPGVLVLVDQPEAIEEQLHMSWRHWLHVFNTVQMLQRVWLVTSTGLSEFDYGSLSADVPSGLLTPGQTPASSSAINEAWTEVLNESLKALSAGLIFIRNRRVLNNATSKTIRVRFIKQVAQRVLTSWILETDCRCIRTIFKQRCLFSWR